MSVDTRTYAERLADRLARAITNERADWKGQAAEAIDAEIEAALAEWENRPWR